MSENVSVREAVHVTLNGLSMTYVSSTEKDLTIQSLSIVTVTETDSNCGYCAVAPDSVRTSLA